MLDQKSSTTKLALTCGKITNMKNALDSAISTKAFENFMMCITKPLDCSGFVNSITEADKLRNIELDRMSRQ